MVYLHGKLCGLPDVSVKEAKERVKTAIKNSDVDFQSKKIVVNLAPADTKKEGSSFDLAISVGILSSMEVIKSSNFEDIVFIGELSLDGKINRVNGILPMCIESLKLGIKKVIVPEENAKEAGIVAGLEVLPAKNLLQVINYLNKQEKIEPIKVDIAEFFKENQKYNFDFSEVKGQENIKRALEVSAAGSHNLLLIRCSRLWKNDARKAFTKYSAGFKFRRSFRNN